MSNLDRHSRAAYRFAALLVFAASAKAAVAQDAAAVLTPAAEALRLDALSAIRFTASGSGYEPAELTAEGTAAAAWTLPPTGGAPLENGLDGAAEAEPGTAEWFEQAAAALVRALNQEAEPPPPVPMRHFRVARHVETVDLETGSLRIERERAPGAVTADAGAESAGAGAERADGRAESAGAGAASAGAGATSAGAGAASAGAGAASAGAGAASATASTADVPGAQHTPGTDDTEGAERPGSVRIIGAASPWSERIAYWTHPAAFVAQALSRDATVSRQTIAGTEYVVVSVEAERDQPVRGFVDPEQRLVKIASGFLDSTGRPVEVEVSWLHWREFGDLSFPTTIVRKHNGELVDTLIVKSVEAIER